MSLCSFVKCGIRLNVGNKPIIVDLCPVVQDLIHDHPLCEPCAMYINRSVNKRLRLQSAKNGYPAASDVDLRRVENDAGYPQFSNERDQFIKDMVVEFELGVCSRCHGSSQIQWLCDSCRTDELVRIRRHYDRLQACHRNSTIDAHLDALRTALEAKELYFDRCVMLYKETLVTAPPNPNGHINTLNRDQIIERLVHYVHVIRAANMKHNVALVKAAVADGTLTLRDNDEIVTTGNERVKYYATEALRSIPSAYCTLESSKPLVIMRGSTLSAAAYLDPILAMHDLMATKTTRDAVCKLDRLVHMLELEQFTLQNEPFGRAANALFQVQVHSTNACKCACGQPKQEKKPLCRTCWKKQSIDA